MSPPGVTDGNLLGVILGHPTELPSESPQEAPYRNLMEEVPSGNPARVLSTIPPLREIFRIDEI